MLIFRQIHQYWSPIVYARDPRRPHHTTFHDHYTSNGRQIRGRINGKSVSWLVLRFRPWQIERAARCKLRDHRSISHQRSSQRVCDFCEGQRWQTIRSGNCTCETIGVNLDITTDTEELRNSDNGNVERDGHGQSSAYKGSN